MLLVAVFSPLVTQVDFLMHVVPKCLLVLLHLW